MKYLFRLNKIKNVGNKCNTILSLSYGKIIIKKDLNEGLTPESYESYQLLNKGDIVIRSTDLQNDHTSLRTGLVKSDGAITSAYIGLKNLNVNLYDSRYYHYFLHDWDITKAIYNEGKGLRQSLNWDDIKNMLLPVLDINEQTAIANYLDSVTSKIDEAISQQQKMIDLLNERKQIIINNAVTKGLNPDAPMKDSGVDWIGEIPKHWICCSFRNIIDVLTDYTANGSFGDLAKNVNYQSEGYARLIRLTDLRENLENENGVWVDKHGYEYLSKSTLYGGELLMANVGAYSGLPCIMPKVDYLTTLAPNMFLIKQDVSKADTSYLFYLLSSYDYFNWLQTIALASAQPKLNKENIRSLQILLPPRVEQEQIVRHIQDKIKPLELAISVAKQQISLLQERKQIIINDVVTGKVKVS